MIFLQLAAQMGPAVFFLGHGPENQFGPRAPFGFRPAGSGALRGAGQRGFFIFPQNFCVFPQFGESAQSNFKKIE